MRAEHFTPPVGHPLHGSVLAVFRLRAHGAYRTETILPKGNVDVLFNLGDQLHAAGDRFGTYAIAEAAVRVVGLQRRPIVTWPDGQVDLIGVSMRPEACASILGLPPGELADGAADGVDLLPDTRILAERLHATPTFAAQCDLLVEWLLRRQCEVRGADAVRLVCRQLRRVPSADAVGDAARVVGVSSRHLRRLFDHQVGVAPAEYVRLMRFVDAMRLAGSTRTLTEVAHAARYHDQAHLCRDFRAFAGMTPGEYRERARGPAVGHIFSA